MSPKCSRTSSCFHRKSTSVFKQAFNIFQPRVCCWFTGWWFTIWDILLVLKSCSYFLLCQDLGDLNKKIGWIPNMFRRLWNFQPLPSDTCSQFFRSGRRSERRKAPILLRMTKWIHMLPSWICFFVEFFSPNHGWVVLGGNIGFPEFILRGLSQWTSCCVCFLILRVNFQANLDTMLKRS